MHVLAHTSGWLARCERRMTRGITILTYHRVLPEAQYANYPFSSLVIPASVFEQQVAWLAEHCNVTLLADALTASLPDITSKPVVCITFDDGYRDNHNIAAKILESHRLHATFFVTAGLIGTSEYLWFDRAAFQWRNLPSQKRQELVQTFRPAAEVGVVDVNSFPAWMSFLKDIDPEKRAQLLALPSPHPAGLDDSYLLMSLEQLRNLHAHGHEIGSHTLSHPLLPQLSADELQRELTQSRRLLQETLNADIPGLCYPNGSHDQRTIDAAHAAGYSYACTTADGIALPSHDRMRLPRVEINPRHVTTAGKHDSLAFRSALCRLRSNGR